MSDTWFELSDAGWRRLNQRRPLGALLVEGLQNALDEEVERVTVRLGPERIEIEDDGRRGFAEPRLVYTLFESDKTGAPARRGHAGRGLKELLSAADAARVETIGFTVHFEPGGRRLETTARARGTRIVLERRSGEAELAEARAHLRLVIAPPPTVLIVDGEPVVPPQLVATLPACTLETVGEGGQLERRATWVRLYAATGGAHLFELGVPIGPFPTPWHVDVGQRVPRAGAGHAQEPHSRAELLATLVESLTGSVWYAAQLDGAWVEEAIASGRVSDAAVRAYAARRFPPGTLLSTDATSDAAAGQLGGQVLDPAALPAAVREPLTRVLESSRAFAARRAAASEEVRALKPTEEAVLSFYRHLARRILGRSLTIKLIRRAPGADGFVDDATFDRQRRVLRINLLGHWDLGAPLSPASLGLLFHELAHAETDRHDAAFAAALQRVAGAGAALLARHGAALRRRFGLDAGDPEPEVDG